MSQNWYFKNMDKNEYVCSSGNGNLSSTFKNDNSLFITWVMVYMWEGNSIKCFPEHKMPTGNYNDILKSINKTVEYRAKFKSSIYAK